MPKTKKPKIERLVIRVIKPGGKYVRLHDVPIEGVFGDGDILTIDVWDIKMPISGGINMRKQEEL